PLREPVSEAASDGSALDDRGEVEAGGRADAVEDGAHGLGVVAADDTGGTVLAGAADDGDVADRGVALGELGHDRRQGLEHALRQECLLVGCDGLGLRLDGGRAGLTLGPDRFRLGDGAHATGLGLGVRLRAQGVGLTGGLRLGGGSFTCGAGLVGLGLLLGDAGACLGLLDLLDRRRLGGLLAGEQLGLGAGLSLVALCVGDALDVGIQLRLPVLGLLLQNGLLGLGAGEVLGLLGLGARPTDTGVGVG